VTRYEFINAQRAGYPVAMMCRLLTVSRSAYYAWDQARRKGARDPMGGLSDRQVTRAALTAVIVGFHTASRGTYGAPRITADLRDAGHTVSRKTVAKIMQRSGLAGCQPRGFRKTTVPDDEWSGRRRDLIKRVFDAASPNRKWFSDITYLRTWEGWSYLATIIDGCTRQVVGYAIADHMRVDLVLEALDMAVTNHRPPPGVILHTDRGAQYTSDALEVYAARHSIRLSVGAVGACWDNALAESFFGVLKNELIYRQSWPTRAQLRSALTLWIEGWYNERRRHSAIGMISPNAYARRLRYPDAA